MTRSSSEAAGIVRVSRHLGCTYSQKKVVDRCAWLNARSCRRHSEFYSMLGALRSDTNELHPR
jgi:hypothetical protein